MTPSDRSVDSALPDVGEGEPHPRGVDLSRPSRDDEVSGLRTWLVLMKAYRALARHAEHSARSAGLNLSDFIVLELLLNRGDQGVNEIGRRVGLTSGAITTAIDRLESRALIRRIAHPSDRRVRVVCLTESGRELIERLFEGHAERMNHAAMALDHEEQRQLIRLMKKLGLSAERSFDEARDAKSP